MPKGNRVESKSGFMQLRTLVHIVSLVAVLCITDGCAKRKSEWDSPDYSRVYQRARENDSAYKVPSVVNCVNDDLYNCN